MAANALRLGHQAARGSAPASPARPVHRRLHAPRHGAHGRGALAVCPRAASKGSPRRKPPRWPGVLGVFTGKDMKDAGLRRHPVRVGRARTPTRRRRPILRSRSTSCATSATRSRSSSPRTATSRATPPKPSRSTTSRSAVVTDAEKATAEGRAAAPRGGPRQPCASTGRSRAATSRPRSRSADVVVKERIINQRLIPNAMEPRAALAQYMSGRWARSRSG